MHELSLSSAIVNTVVKHAAGASGDLVNLRVGRLRQVVPDTLGSTSSSSRAARCARVRGWSRSS